ncbi:MAG: hypothetical protein ABIO17_11470 [Pseudoxanthomonas sp.]
MTAVACTCPPIIREQRAGQAKAGTNTSYKSNKQLALLDFVLRYYVEQDVDELDLDKLPPLRQ